MSSSSTLPAGFSEVQRPGHAIGYPSHAENLDVWPGFVNPPAGYGEVAFFWWIGDPLTKERLTWQMNKLAGKGVMGLQINYAHSDKGGQLWGYTYPSAPVLYSEAWWELVQWFAKEAYSRGMAVSLSDYTLGISQGWAFDEAVRCYPQIQGAVLKHEIREVKDGQMLDWTLEHAPAALTAVRSGAEGGSCGEGAIDLLASVKQKQLQWQPSDAAEWKVVAVWVDHRKPSVDPMHPQSGPAIVEKFFQPFEDRNPGQGGKALNFFFSDELDFRVDGWMWNDAFAEEFKKRKGYDVRPELAALFADIGPRTPKIRLDYNDVQVALAEENYFKPVYDWHEARGMIYGCDHGGRGRNVVEFGDYFRTQRWNQGPGCDQPGLSCDLVKNKVASSIAHLYERPRVWIEGYYGSGWGTSCAQVAGATFANYLQGQNLLTLHGLYYSTHGGWWEWAPPCNHWRMPYWEHMGVFLKCQERLAYLLTQGRHVCDVAILYPVAPMEAGVQGKDAVDTAFNTGYAFYPDGRDFDYMDFQSLDRATIKEGLLQVSGESYRVLVLPALRAIRHGTLEKAAAFAEQGGIVIAIGALPTVSDRAGRNDPQVAALVERIFGLTAPAAEGLQEVRKKNHAGGGVGMVAPSPAEALAELRDLVPHRFRISTGVPKSYMMRKIGDRQIFAFYEVKPESECMLQATGKVERWDPWTGRAEELPVLSQEGGWTRLRMPGGLGELTILAVSPGKAMVETTPALEPMTREIPLEGDWEIQYKPTMDNQWGDFRWPPSAGCIGPEATFFRYAPETSGAVVWHRPDFDDSTWAKATAGYGEKFRLLGPLPGEVLDEAWEARVAGLKQLPAETPVLPEGKTAAWKPYAFSWERGVEGDWGHQGYHGLKERMYDEFIRLGKKTDKHTRLLREPEEEGTRYYLWSTLAADRDMDAVVLVGGMKPAAMWVNGQKIAADTGKVRLAKGANPVLLRYDGVGTGYVVAVEVGSELATARENELPADDRETLGTLAMRWHGKKGIVPWDVRLGEARPAGWYRFKTPPGTRELRIKASGAVRCWVNGVEAMARGQNEAGWMRLMVKDTLAQEGTAAVRIEQARGEYGGSALLGAVQFAVERGRMPAGDWSKMESLATYSGGVWYRKSVKLSAYDLRGQVMLEAGQVVASAELHVNGKPAGVKVAPPWTWDITPYAQAGENQLEMLVYNTLGNHYRTIPTRYLGDVASGLIGPVKVQLVK